VWLQAAPEEHMGRVAAQGDTRPMAASKEAMEDLRRILNGRAAFYSKADLSVDTSGKTLAQIQEHMAHDSLVGWGWRPGGTREPAPGTQAQFGALIAAWIESGAACPR